MRGHAEHCVERYCELAPKSVSHLKQVATPFIDAHHLKEDYFDNDGEVVRSDSV